MGCDIHSMAEVKWRDAGEWERIDEPLWVNPWPYYVSSEPVSYWNVPYRMEPFAWRHYALFGALAGVRDRTATVLFPPRGIPEDASEEWKKEVADWGHDMHSHSWLTFDELEQVSAEVKSAWPDEPGRGEGVAAAIEDALAPLRRLRVERSLPIRIVFGFDS